MARLKAKSRVRVKTKPKRVIKKPALVASECAFDWKETPTAEDLQEVLGKFGITVTEHPMCEGNDTYGFIFSNRQLTRAELREYSQSQ